MNEEDDGGTYALGDGIFEGYLGRSAWHGDRVEGGREIRSWRMQNTLLIHTHGIHMCDLLSLTHSYIAIVTLDFVSFIRSLFRSSFRCLFRSSFRCLFRSSFRSSFPFRFLFTDFAVLRFMCGNLEVDTVNIR